MIDRPDYIRDRELQLIIDACRRPSDLSQVEVVRASLATSINWPRLTALVRRHRVAGLVNDALHRAGADREILATSGMQQLAQQSAFAALQRAQESVRLQGVFAASGIDSLIVKGAPLGMLAYGDPGIKQYWDIDLLVRRDAVREAQQLLLDMGYKMIEPSGLNDAQFMRFAEFAKEAILIGPTGIAVELHWRLTDPGELFARAEPFVDYRRVAVAGGEVTTLNDRLQLAYLACHGQSHGWSRLKWLADVNGFLAHQSAGTIGVMLDDAARLGVARYAESAVWLCHELFGLAVDDTLTRAWHRQAPMRFILAANRRCIAGPVGGSDVSLYSATNAAIIGSMLAASPGWRIRWAIMRTLWIRPVERARGKPGVELGYSLRRLARLVIMTPSRIARDRARYRQAQSQLRRD